MTAPDAAHVFGLGRQGLRIPGPEGSCGPLSRKNALLSVPRRLPRRQLQRAGSAVSRLSLAADAGGQCELVLPASAGITPVLMDEMGTGTLSRRARRRPELTARGAAPVRAAARSSPGRAWRAPWRTPARRRCSARRADRRMAGALARPGQMPGWRGRPAADSTAC